MVFNRPCVLFTPYIPGEGKQASRFFDLYSKCLFLNN